MLTSPGTSQSSKLLFLAKVWKALENLNYSKLKIYNTQYWQTLWDTNEDKMRWKLASWYLCLKEDSINFQIFSIQELLLNLDGKEPYQLPSPVHFKWSLEWPITSSLGANLSNNWAAFQPPNTGSKILKQCNKLSG